MDLVYPGYYIRAGSSVLNGYTDDEILIGVEELIKHAYKTFERGKMSIVRHTRVNKDGTTVNSALNYTLSSVNLTYRQICIAFYDNSKNDRYGFAWDVDFGIGYDRFNKDHVALKDFHDHWSKAFGLTAYHGIPLVCQVVKDSAGKIDKIAGNTLRVTGPVVYGDRTLQCMYGFCSTVPVSAKEANGKNLHDVRFISKLHCLNAAYKLVYKDVLHTGNNAARFIRVSDLTKLGEKVFALHRFKTECFNCSDVITLYDISIDLDFFHGFCRCDNSKSCFKWPGEDMLRYRPNEHIRKSLFELDKPYETSRIADKDNIIRMIIPVTIHNQSPLQFINSTTTAFMAELQNERREMMLLHRTAAKIVECYKMNLNTPQHKPTDKNENSKQVKSTNTDEDSGAKYDDYYLEVEVTRGEFWNEVQMMDISNVKLREVHADGTIQSVISEKAVKNKRVAHGSWIAKSKAAPTSPNNFRFIMSARVSNKGGSIAIEKGKIFEAIPIIAQYRKLNLKKLGNRWQRYYTRTRIQTLKADVEHVQTDILDNTDAVCMKTVTFKATLDQESSSKLSQWNPDMSKTYAGFTATFPGKYLRDGETADEDFEVSGRVLSVNHGDVYDNGKKVNQVCIMAVFSIIKFWQTEIEKFGKSLQPIKIRFWEDICLTPQDAASLPCGIPAGAEGTLKTVEDYEDEDDYYDDYAEQSTANSWLDRSDDPDIDTSNINGNDVFKMFKSRRVLEYTKDCPIVQTRKHTRLHLPKMGTTPAQLYQQMRWERGDDAFPFLRFLLEEANADPKINLHVKDINLKPDAQEIVDKLLRPLNDSQRESFKKLDNKVLSFVVGPPGTGKTVTGSVIVTALSCKEYGPCGVLSSSNQSCDDFYRYLTKLKKEHNLPIRIVRMLSRKKETTATDDIDYLHDLVKKDVKNWKPHLQNAYKIAREKGSAKVNPRVRIQLVAQTIKSSVAALKNVDIVVSTVATATDGRLNGLVDLCRKAKLRPPVICIDECSRITMADVMPIMAMEPVRMLLLGDDSQLPPILKSQESVLACLDVPWMRFARSLPYYDKITTMLSETYRLTPQICELVSASMYQGKLKPAAAILERDSAPEIQALQKKICTVFDNPKFPSENIRVYSYKGPKEESDNMKTWNPLEVDYVVSIVHNLVYRCDVAPERILVIAMYKKQVNLIQKAILKEGIQGVIVSTVDGAQGMESDVVILSQVRSNVKNHIGFLQKPQRFNVAVSRSKHFLFWIMDYKCFRNSARVSSEAYTRTLAGLKVRSQPLRVLNNF